MPARMRYSAGPQFTEEVKMKRRVSCLVLCCLGGASVPAYPEWFGPFPAGITPHVFPMRKGVQIRFTEEKDRKVYVYATGKDAPVHVWFCRVRKPFGCFVGVRDAAGTVILPEAKIKGGYVAGARFAWGLLNEDKKPDFVIETWSGGCGLAATNYFPNFLLSTGDSFTLVPVANRTSSRNSFVDLNKDGRCEFIHTAFVFGEEGRDGRVHNYWVHNLLAFKKNRLVSSNRTDRRFPSWIWYTFKENHQNTTQLTGRQKKRLWKKQAKGLFPQAEDLAEEQG
jgi:hypothetical protein